MKLLVETAGPLQEELLRLHAQADVLPTANENDVGHLGASWQVAGLG